MRLKNDEGDSDVAKYAIVNVSWRGGARQRDCESAG
jgi:hypothetical protein